MLLLLFGGIFAIIFVLNSAVRIRSDRIGFSTTLLAFLTVLVSLTALIQNNLGENAQNWINNAFLAIALMTILISLVLLIIEWRRLERDLSQSRGLLGLGVGLLLVISIFTVPFMAAYFAPLPSPLPASSTPIVTQVSDNLISDDRDGSFNGFFRNIFLVISETTSLDNDAILEQLKQGITIAELVENNGGDLNAVVESATKLTQDQLQQLMADGSLSRIQGALILSNLEFLIRTAMNSDIEPDRLEDLIQILQATELPQLYTNTPLPTQFPTFTPTITRTPRPTLTPTNTRQPFARPIPTTTPTLQPTDCEGTLAFNLRLRAAPTTESETLLTIPFDASVQIFGRSADSTWLFISYEGMTGWASSEFITLNQSCDNLPVREPNNP